MSVKNSSSFERLKGAACAGLLASGGLCAGVANAATATFPLSVTRQVVKTGGTVSAKWKNIHNGYSYPSFTPSSDACEQTLRIFNHQSSPATLHTVSGLDIPGCGNQAFGIHNHSLDYLNPDINGNPHYFNLFSLMIDDVFFTNPDDTVDLSDNEVSSDIVQMSGVNVSIQYKFFGEGDQASDRVVVRAITTLTNDSGSDTNVNVKIVSLARHNLSSAKLKTTSDGDSVLEASDNWYVKGSFDQVVNGNDEPSSSGNTMISLYGANAMVAGTELETTAVSPGDFNLTDRYEGSVVEYTVEIPAGETVRLASFTEVTESNAESKAAGADFNDIETVYKAGFFESMPLEEIATVVNYVPEDYDINDLSEEEVKKLKSSSGVLSVFNLFVLSLLGTLGALGARSHRSSAVKE